MNRTAQAMAVAALVIAGCGGGDGPDEAALADDPTLEECADAFVEVLEGFDTEGLDPSDGFGDDERALAEDRFSELQADHPFMADESPCRVLIDGASSEQADELIGRLDPEVVAVLGAGAAQQFDEVDDSIGG